MASQLTLVQTIPESLQLRITDVAVSATKTSATITWTTDRPANSWVEFGLTVQYGDDDNGQNDNTTHHSVTLDALRPDTGYFFRVRSRTPSGELAVAPGSFFTGEPSPGSPAAAVITWAKLTYEATVLVEARDTATDQVISLGTARSGDLKYVVPWGALVPGRSYVLTLTFKAKNITEKAYSPTLIIPTAATGPTVVTIDFPWWEDSGTETQRDTKVPKKKNEALWITSDPLGQILLNIIASVITTVLFAQVTKKGIWPSLAGVAIAAVMVMVLQTRNPWVVGAVVALGALIPLVPRRLTHLPFPVWKWRRLEKGDQGGSVAEAVEDGVQRPAAGELPAKEGCEQTPTAGDLDDGSKCRKKHQTAE